MKRVLLLLLVASLAQAQVQTIQWSKVSGRDTVFMAGSLWGISTKFVTFKDGSYMSSAAGFSDTTKYLEWADSAATAGWVTREKFRLDTTYKAAQLLLRVLYSDTGTTAGKIPRVWYVWNQIQDSLAEYLLRSDSGVVYASFPQFRDSLANARNRYVWKPDSGVVYASYPQFRDSLAAHWGQLSLRVLYSDTGTTAAKIPKNWYLWNQIQDSLAEYALRANSVLTGTTTAASIVPSGTSGQFGWWTRPAGWNYLTPTTTDTLYFPNRLVLNNGNGNTVIVSPNVAYVPVGQSVYIGAGAGGNNPDGGDQVVIGWRAHAARTTAVDNTLIGLMAGAALTSGSYNTAFGNIALSANIIGWFSTSIGTQNLPVFLDSAATSVGYQAGRRKTNGTHFTSIGFQSGYADTLGTYNTFIGAGADASAGTFTNSTALGYAARVTRSNQMVFGNSSIIENKMTGRLLIDSLTISQFPTNRIPFFTAGGVMVSNSALTWDGTTLRVNVGGGEIRGPDIVATSSWVFSAAGEAIHNRSSGNGDWVFRYGSTAGTEMFRVTQAGATVGAATQDSMLTILKGVNIGWGLKVGRAISGAYLFSDANVGRARLTVGTVAGTGAGKLYAGDSLYIGSTLFADASRNISAGTGAFTGTNSKANILELYRSASATAVAAVDTNGVPDFPNALVSGVIVGDSVRVAVPGLTTATGDAVVCYRMAASAAPDTLPSFRINAAGYITLTGKHGYTVKAFVGRK